MPPTERARHAQHQPFSGDGRGWITIAIFIAFGMAMFALIWLMPPRWLLWLGPATIVWIGLVAWKPTREIGLAPIGYVLLPWPILLTIGRRGDVVVDPLSASPRAAEVENVLAKHAEAYCRLGCMSAGRWLISNIESNGVCYAIERLECDEPGMIITITLPVPAMGSPKVAVVDIALRWGSEDPHTLGPLAIRVQRGGNTPFRGPHDCVYVWMPESASAETHMSAARSLARRVPMEKRSISASDDPEQAPIMRQLVREAFAKEQAAGRLRAPNARGWQYPTLRGACLGAWDTTWPVSNIRRRRAAADAARVLGESHTLARPLPIRTS